MFPGRIRDRSQFRAGGPSMRRFSQATTVLLISIPVFAIYLPCALWLKHDYEVSQRRPPIGALVRLGYFAPVQVREETDDVRKAGHHFFQAVFRWTDDKGEPPQDGVADPRICVYENDVSLGSPVIAYVSYSQSYALAFYTSDNSDPRYNGRDYWIVRR